METGQMQPTDILPERIAVKITISSTSEYNGVGCWEYTGYLEKNGYAKVSWQGKTSWLHRVVCKLFHGTAGEITLHGCDNPKCCCPLHLTPGNQKENVADMIAKGRLRGATAKYVYGQEA